MTLIVEDGTGLGDSEAYATVAEADKYFSDRGVGEWALLTDDEKERGLRLGADYMELRFSSRFRSSKLVETQTLSFPRQTPEGIPVALKRANMEYALRALQAPLVADPVTDASGMAIKTVREVLGPLQEETEYATTARDLFKPYPAADNLLKSLLRPSGLIR